MSLPSTVTGRVIAALFMSLSLMLGAAVLMPGQADAIDGPVAVVFVARADAFPDALAGGPLASLNGAPLLLTDSTTLSPETATELERLQPTRIVILGGLAAVSADVATTLGDYADQVDRIGGSSRTETAALIAAALPSLLDANSVGGITPDQIVTEDEASVFLTVEDVADFLTAADTADFLTAADTAGFLTADHLLNLDADTVDGLDSTAFVPSEVSIPFFEQLDAGTATILAEHGPLTLSFFCQDTDPSVTAELGVSTSVDGAFSDENSGGFDIVDGYVDLADSLSGDTPGFDNDIDEGVAMVEDDGVLYKLSVDGESTAYSVNTFGADCVVAGILNLQQAPVGLATDTFPAVPLN